MASHLGAALHPPPPPRPPAKGPDRDGSRGPIAPRCLVLTPPTFPPLGSRPRDGSALRGGGAFSPPASRPTPKHLLTARPATARLSAGAGANPIYRPGQARPARMRLRLTPPDSALPSPARQSAGPRGAPCRESAPAHLEGPHSRLA